MTCMKWISVKVSLARDKVAHCYLFLSQIMRKKTLAGKSQDSRDALGFKKKCFLSIRKRNAGGVYKFLQFEGSFLKTSFLWPISVDGRLIVETELCFQNSPTSCQRCLKLIRNKKMKFSNILSYHVWKCTIIIIFILKKKFTRSC